MCVVCKGRKIKGITIVPKPEPKPKPKPKTMVVDMIQQKIPYRMIEVGAIDHFWDDWEAHHFDLSVVLAFVKAIPMLESNSFVRFTDGKSVVVGSRTGEKSGVLLGGYRLNRIHSQSWAEENGYRWVSHRKINVTLDHKRHFIERYKKRKFNLALMAAFISRVPTARLGQRIKVIGEDDILIGTRTSMYGGLLITGMKRGEIDMEEYVDYRVNNKEE